MADILGQPQFMNLDRAIQIAERRPEPPPTHAQMVRAAEDSGLPVLSEADAIARRSDPGATTFDASVIPPVTPPQHHR